MSESDEHDAESETIGRESMVDYAVRIEDLNAKHAVAESRLEDPRQPPERTEA